MRIIGLGQVVFAIAITGLGVLSLVTGHFASVWQPVPLWLPWREYFAYGNGLLMCAAGVGLLAGRTALLAAFTLTVYLLVWLVVLHVPLVVAAPLKEVTWGGCAENATLVAGGWILYASLATQGDRTPLKFITAERGLRIARILFAIALPFIGLEHLLYAQSTADLVPAWLPYRLGWAYLTGAGHIAAGVGILLAICPRLAATLEAGMMSLFTLLIWVPAVAAAPTHRFQWTALLISSAITGAAWIVAESYRGAPWLAWRSPTSNPASV